MNQNVTDYTQNTAEKGERKRININDLGRAALSAVTHGQSFMFCGRGACWT